MECLFRRYSVRVYASLSYRLVTDRTSLLAFAASTFVMVTIGGVLYGGGFGPNDGEYSWIFVVTPFVQSPFVVVALGVSLWQKRIRRRAS